MINLINKNEKFFKEGVFLKEYCCQLLLNIINSIIVLDNFQNFKKNINFEYSLPKECEDLNLKFKTYDDFYL